MVMAKPIVADIAYSPQEASSLAVKKIDLLRHDIGGGVKTGITDVDAMVLPFRPGELITVLGYTSNYKSGFMNWLSKEAIKSIPTNANEIVIRVTWEQSVEEDTLTWLAGDADMSITKLARGLVDEAEWKLLLNSSVRRAITPMWIVGHSEIESRDRRQARPRMTMTDVGKAIQYIVNEATDTQWRVRMIVLDYLQRIRPDKEDGDSKREQMMEAVNRAKDAAISFGCPVVLGVQTRRESQDRDDKFPCIDDGQETSNIEQSSDKMFGLWYPIKTEKEGKLIDGIPVSKNLLMLRLLKQKLGEAPKTFALYVDPEHNRIGSADKTGASKERWYEK
jgi:replicative DNA helicase